MKKFTIILFMFGFLLTGCALQPTEEDRLQEFITLWEEQNFADMYEMLTAESQANMTKEKFIQRYTDIYKDIEVSNLQVEFKQPDEEVKPEDGRIKLPISVAMDTIAGKIDFTKTATLTEQESDDGKNWFINWDTTFIFPQLKEGDNVGLTILKAKRGEIVDRNNQGLAINGNAVEIGVVPQQLGDNQETKERLATLLDISVAEINQALSAKWVKPNFFVPIKRISANESALIFQLMQLNGVTKQQVEARIYPAGEAAAHLIGYIGSITKEELDKMEGYSAHDKIGKRGLEQIFEEKLKGENGARIFINDDTIAEKGPIDGETVKLTIDIQVQNALYQEMSREPGAAAAIHPKTGETLALVSTPAFDPHDFVLGMSDEKWAAYNDDPRKPLLNRFKQAYAPGSTIKPLTAAIALKSNIITNAETKNITGLKWQKNSTWGNYFVKRVTDPKKPVNLRDALIFSDNIYFAQLALEIGKDQFEAGLRNFGFAENMTYVYPITASKISNKGLGKETLLADSGYGQGQLEMSVLHLAAAYTPFVNGGNLLMPTLRFGEPQENWHEKVVPADAAEIILDDLVQVIEDPNGTAHDAIIAGLKLAGKTGTAEIKQKQGETGTENGFFVVMDTEDPRLLVAMMIENVRDKGGSHYVVPKVRNVVVDLLK